MYRVREDISSEPLSPRRTGIPTGGALLPTGRGLQRAGRRSHRTGGGRDGTGGPRRRAGRPLRRADGRRKGAGRPVYPLLSARQQLGLSGAGSLLSRRPSSPQSWRSLVNAIP